MANVGSDVFGRQALQQFEREGIQGQFISTDPDEPSGVALIGVDGRGENSIMVASGANARLGEEQVASALAAITEPRTDRHPAAAGNAHSHGRLRHPAGPRTRYAGGANPAPAQSLDASVLACLYAITPNETEAELLTGIRVTDEATARQAAQHLHESGVPNVVITLGSRGAYVSSTEGTTEPVVMPTPPVTAVDTTAAGDCFNGALAVALAEGKSLTDAVAFACKAASISVTRLGAQASLPHRAEVDALPLITV